jgi:predicted Zn finger-like uncharacterized protein
MLIDCICGESKFAINAEQIGFDGRLVKCGKCGKEWFQESKQEIIENKLINLDQSLRAKEIILADDKNYYSDKISSLEKELKSKSKDIKDQKILEQRIILFESRVKDAEADLIRQKKYEERSNNLQKELEKRTLDLFIKNTALEKRSLAIQEQVEDKSLDDRLSSLEEKLVTKKIGGRIINAQKPMEVFDADKVDTSAKPFEIDEITKETSEKENQSDAVNSQPEKDSKTLKVYEDSNVHEDNEDSSRIGRAGDLLKRKKI